MTCAFRCIVVLPADTSRTPLPSRPWSGACVLCLRGYGVHCTSSCRGHSPQHSQVPCGASACSVLATSPRARPHGCVCTPRRGSGRDGRCTFYLFGLPSTLYQGSSFASTAAAGRRTWWLLSVVGWSAMPRRLAAVAPVSVDVQSAAASASARGRRPVGAAPLATLDARQGRTTQSPTMHDGGRSSARLAGRRPGAVAPRLAARGRGAQGTPRPAAPGSTSASAPRACTPPDGEPGAPAQIVAGVSGNVHHTVINNKSASGDTTAKVDYDGVPATVAHPVGQVNASVEAARDAGKGPALASEGMNALDGDALKAVACAAEPVALVADVGADKDAGVEGGAAAGAVEPAAPVADTGTNQDDGVLPVPVLPRQVPRDVARVPPALAPAPVALASPDVVVRHVPSVEALATAPISDLLASAPAVDLSVPSPVAALVVSAVATPAVPVLDGVSAATSPSVGVARPTMPTVGERVVGRGVAGPPSLTPSTVLGGQATVPLTAGLPPRGFTGPGHGGAAGTKRGGGGSSLPPGREPFGDMATRAGATDGVDQRDATTSTDGRSPLPEVTQSSQSKAFRSSDGVGSDVTDAAPPISGATTGAGSRAVPPGRRGRGPTKLRSDVVLGRPPRSPSDVEDHVVLVAAPQPRTGVYELKEATRCNIATLLRTLFVVRTVSDRSIMPFLGVAYYAMAFSYLVGIASPDERCDFFDELSEAFEQPVAMKYFMEEAFRCGPGGLHVGGRTKCEKHVFGQPDGVRGDVLRDRLNPTNAKVQWLSRRLCLRTGVDIQPGARCTGGGLSLEDRATIAAAVTREGVRIGLRERGCAVKFAGDGGVGNAPLSLAFHWDAAETWRPDSLESGLVADMQEILLRGMPGLHADRDPSKMVKSKAFIQQREVKRKDVGSELVGADRKKKRKTQEQLDQSEPVAGPCAHCGGAGTSDASGTPQVISADLEQWSADVVRSEHLPRGGHVLAMSLPMHMDCGSAGRLQVSAQIQKTSSAQGPPYRYTVVVEPSPQPPQQMPAIRGASFVNLDGRTVPTAALSHDILRSVGAHLSRRRLPPAPSSSAADGPANADAPEQGGVQLCVRRVPRPVPLLHRVELASQYELSCQAELVDRSPGRIIMFYEGIAPLPVQGTSTL